MQEWEEAIRAGKTTVLQSLLKETLPNLEKTRTAYGQLVFPLAKAREAGEGLLAGGWSLDEARDKIAKYHERATNASLMHIISSNLNATEAWVEERDSVTQAASPAHAIRWWTLARGQLEQALTVANELPVAWERVIEQLDSLQEDQVEEQREAVFRFEESVDRAHAHLFAKGVSAELQAFANAFTP